MTTYRATFHASNGYTEEDIKARTPEQALQKAHALYDRDMTALDWCPYDLDCRSLDEITITGPGDAAACWQSDDLRLQMAAADLFDALKQAVEALNTTPRFPVPHLLTDSYRIASICDRAIAKAKGGAA